jgi:hypothetical protein
MKKNTIILAFVIAMTITIKAQIPNSGFENWTSVGSYENAIGWNNCNSISTGTFFPVTKSSDHYPLSVGNYSIRVENKIPLSNCSTYGFAQTSNNNYPCKPAFRITGHPTNFCGYYKSFPQNNDTIQIGLMLFQNGVWIAGAEFISTNTVSNWTSFNIPISLYTTADSATISLAAFYNDTTCGFPYGPFGNSVLYVDNLSFDNLITSLSEQDSEKNTFSLYPNPATDNITLNLNKTNNSDLTLNFYNVTGTLVRSKLIKSEQQKIDIGDLSNGIYFVEIKSINWTEKQKLIIQK